MCDYVGILLNMLVLIVAVLVDTRMLDIDHVSHCVDSVTVHKDCRLLLAVEDKPQHDRQKYVCQSSKESECRKHSILLSIVLVEEYNCLSECVGESDANVTGSDKSVYLVFGSNTTHSDLHLSAHFND
jgi:hypothetical protein